MPFITDLALSVDEAGLLPRNIDGNLPEQGVALATP